MLLLIQESISQQERRWAQRYVEREAQAIFSAVEEFEACKLAGPALFGDHTHSVHTHIHDVRGLAAARPRSLSPVYPVYLQLYPGVRSPRVNPGCQRAGEFRPRPPQRQIGAQKRFGAPDAFAL